MSVCRSWSRAQWEMYLRESSAADELKQAHANLRKRERVSTVVDYATSLNANFNAEITDIVADWMIEVHEQYEFGIETEAASIAYFDLICSKCTVTFNRLQLVAAVCMLLAGKIYEVQFPEPKDLTALCEGVFSLETLLQWERDAIKNGLHFKLAFPTPATFARDLALVCSLDSHVHALVDYYIIQCLRDYPSRTSGITAHNFAVAIVHKVLETLPSALSAPPVALLELAGLTKQEIEPALKLIEGLPQRMASRWGREKFKRDLGELLPEELRF